MGVEKYVNLYEGNIVVVAGSPNSGKTAMMLNLIHLNQDRFPVYYFCSEMGETELGDRLSYFEQEGRQLEDWTFEAINRATNFADVIRPDCINIIDFLELTQDIYLVNQYLTAITHAIGKGVAIIAIQKKVGASLGRGQEFSLEKPRLYLSMDTNRLTILKGKNWTQRNLNPNGLFINYRIEDGYRFVPTSDWNWAS
jgi:GTPase SAR1 family protein